MAGSVFDNSFPRCTALILARQLLGRRPEEIQFRREFEESHRI